MEPYDKKLERSPVTLKYFLISSAVVSVLLLTVSLFLLAELRLLLGVSIPLLRIMVVFFFPIVWLVSALIMYKKWNKETYSYNSDGLSIDKQMTFGDSQVDTIPFGAVESIQLRQTRLGQKHNYGDIVLRLKKDQDPIILKLISNPKNYITDLNRHIGSTSVHVK